MKISKFCFFIIILGILPNFNLFCMTNVAGGSRLYRNFIEALGNKSKYGAEHFSDLYYQIEDENEQKEALKLATKNNIKITGQEAEQKKIKEELRSESQEPIKLTKVQEFERDLKIPATDSSLRKSLSELKGKDLEEALELAVKYNKIFPEYSQQSKFTSKSDELSDEYDNLIIQTDLQEQKNREKKENIHVRLALSERLQDKKENLAKINKQIKDLEQQLKELSGQTEIKTYRADALIRSQNSQLKNQNESLKAQLEKLQKRSQELKKI